MSIMSTCTVSLNFLLTMFVNSTSFLFHYSRLSRVKPGVKGNVLNQIKELDLTT